MIDLTYKVQQDIDQLKAQNGGKATPEMVDKAIQQEVIQHTTSTPRGPWNPLAILGSPNSTTKQYNFEIPMGATKTVKGRDGQMHYTNDAGTVDLGLVK